MYTVCMSDDEQSLSNPESQEANNTISYNLKLLDQRLFQNPSNLPPEEQIALQGVLTGSRDTREPPYVFDHLVILYDSKTGKFMKPRGQFEEDSYSALRTWIKSKQVPLPHSYAEPFILLTKRWPDMPSPADYLGAVSGKDLPLLDKPLIYPERLFAPLENSDQMGVPEPWGGHVLRPHPGDNIVLKTIQKFNEQYGPAR